MGELSSNLENCHAIFFQGVKKLCNDYVISSNYQVII